MIELFAHKQICCKHCGFGFIYTGFGNAANVVCPACGEENELPPTPAPKSKTEPESQTVTPNFSDFSPPTFNKTDGKTEQNSKQSPEPAQSDPEEPPPLLPEEKPIPCSVDHCPLFGNEPDNPAARAVTEQLGLRLLKRKKRRKTILAWTVTLQVCVILGTMLFFVKTHWWETTPSDSKTPLQLAKVDNSQESATKSLDFLPINSPPIIPPAQILLAPSIPLEAKAVPQAPIASQNPQPESFDAEQFGTPYIVPSPEPAQEIFPPPVHNYADAPPPLDVPNVTPQIEPIGAPEMLTIHSDSNDIPPPLPAEPPATLEMADALLESAKTTLVSNPESSVEQAVRAAKIYDLHGHKYPDSLYWILGNAFASVSWGEPLLESAPAVKTMTVSPDNRYLLTQLADKTVWLWDLTSTAQDRLGYRLEQGTAEYVKFVFTPDLRWIIGGQKNGTIRIWDMSLKNPAESVVAFAERVPDLQDIQISPNGQWLAAFGHAPRNVIATNGQQNLHVQQVNYQPARQLSQGSAPYPVLLWNLRQMETGIMPMAMVVPSMPQPVQVMQFSPNSDRIAIGRSDAVVRVYDLMPRGVTEEPFILRGHQLGITQIVFAPSGQWIATGSQDNSVRLWNLTSSKVSPESATLYGHVGWIKTLTIDPTGEYLLSGSYDRTIRIWNIKHNRIATALKTEPIILETAQGIPDSLQITSDGDKMIVLGNEGSLGVYHFPTILTSMPEDALRSITFRNSKLSISQCRMTSESKSLIFGYEHLEDHSNSGIRVWALQTQGFVPK